MRQGWCIGLRLPVQLRANNQSSSILLSNTEKLIILNIKSTKDNNNRLIFNI